MILAGIDEAGLGPNIGPLVTACAALRVPEDWQPDTPWEQLRDACCRQPGKGEERPAVADSKALYSRGGADALGRTLAAFIDALPEKNAEVILSAAFPGAPENAADEGAAHSASHLPSQPASHSAPHPCYGEFLERREFFPAPAARDGAAWAAAFRSAGAAAARLEAGVLFENALNSRFAAGLNKNRALLMETGARLAGLAAAFPEDRILAVVDKQGGRNDYLAFLTGLFPGAWVETAAAGAAESVYRVRRAGGGVEVRFVAKGDRDSFATALASMAAKYLRERAMAALNAWFGARVPDLRGTAGYPEDAKRWRADVLRAGAAAALEADRVWRVK